MVSCAVALSGLMAFPPWGRGGQDSRRRRKPSAPLLCCRPLGWCPRTPDSRRGRAASASPTGFPTPAERCQPPPRSWPDRPTDAPPGPAGPEAPAHRLSVALPPMSSAVDLDGLDDRVEVIGHLHGSVGVSRSAHAALPEHLLEGLRVGAVIGDRRRRVLQLMAGEHTRDRIARGDDALLTQSLR